MNAGAGAGDGLVDVFESRETGPREVVHRGMKWDLVADTVQLDGAAHRREYLRHPGSVAVLALDDADRVLLINQYRHPVRMRLWELPAGLLDMVGESPVDAAARELYEEADVRAGRWDVLVDYVATPGGSDETQRIFLARDVVAVPAVERHAREDEEAHIVTRWVPLDEVVEGVLAGRLHNVGLCIGALAATAARDRAWSTLRHADAPWPQHPAGRPPEAGGPREPVGS